MQQIGTELEGWPPGTHHYTDGSAHYAINADLSPFPGARAEAMVGEVLAYLGSSLDSTKTIARETYVWACTPEGLPTDEHGMTPLHTLPPGASHVDAVARVTTLTGTPPPRKRRPRKQAP